MTAPFPTCDDRPIWDLWLSALWLPSVTVATELGIFESLAEGPRSSDAVARQWKLQPRGCNTLLRMLVALDLLTLHEGEYQLTPVARQYLCRGDPFYWGHVWPASSGANANHARLRDALKIQAPQQDDGLTDLPPVAVWEAGQVTLEQAGRIARFMNSHSMAAAAGLARSVDFSGVRRLLDVGGGSGCFSIALAAAHPEIRCTILDLPAMCEVAAGYIGVNGAGGRVDTLSVDFFREAWPQGYDAHFFSNVFHDWTFETCAELAARAFAAVTSGGRILLHEMLLDDAGTGPRTAAAFSMLMLAGTRGQQFTFAELRGILAGAGFRDIAVRTSYGYYSLVSGRKP
jgi:O-methyltransferase domain/Dimerisation domain